MPITLYRRQRQILDFIRQYIDKYGYAPTLAEIAEAIGVSSLATIHEHLQTLVQKGIIKKFEGAVRGIEILDKNMASALKGVELPIMGFIAAGLPIQPYTDTNATINVPANMITGKKRTFVLQVKGNSMIEEGILDHDYVIIEQQDSAHDGDIVIALLPSGLTTLKKYFKEANRIRLEPANTAMEPIYATSVRIQGRCVGVIRRFQ